MSKITVADGAHIVKSIPDAQECDEGVQRFSHSPEATMDANTIREKIHALKLDKSWSGTATKFLQHYESQILLLESITDDRALLRPEKTKMIMLESAVKSNKNLAALMTVEHLDIVNISNHYYENVM